MKYDYRKQLTELLVQARPQISVERRLEFKNSFGAIAGYVDGCIFVSYGKFGVALRLPPDALENLFKNPDVEHLKYFPNGHIKKEYAVVPERILDDKQYFGKLIDLSVNYVLGLATDISQIHGIDLNPEP